MERLGIVNFADRTMDEMAAIVYLDAGVATLLHISSSFVADYDVDLSYINIGSSCSPKS